MRINGPSGWFGLVVLALVLGFAVKQNLDREKAAAWPSVQGTVISAQLSDSNRTHYDKEQGFRLGGNGVRYSLRLRYEFDVNGRTFTGNRLGFDTSTTSLDSAQRMLEKYGKGAAVKVHYNPANPDDSMAMR